ncbi:MAG TPA: c-type cytochrome [Solirubrobacteraceae bacterium]|jgi:mono/diheme cytochrome c family protein|nr:c-type cytochrome [Solirubrobacteraceae bacterium]
MTRRRALIPVLTVAGAAFVTACGSQGINLGSKEQQLKAQNPAEAAQVRHGATLFQQRCSGCHTLQAAGTHGSATSIKYRLRTNGPNFNNRQEQYAQVLYAIRNGGFSGAIMPQNIAVGADAVDLAKFVSRYAGTKVSRPAGPSGQPAGF